MIAVFGPKSLYSLLPIWSLPPVEFAVANIIHDTSAKNAAINSQSSPFEPGARATDGDGPASSGGDLMIFCLHRGQVNTPIATVKKKRLPQKSGTRAWANASPAR